MHRGETAEADEGAAIDMAKYLYGSNNNNVKYNIPRELASSAIATSVRARDPIIDGHSRERSNATCQFVARDIPLLLAALLNHLR